MDINQKPVALVLGGTIAHIDLIRNLKNRGFHTVLIDYLPNPAAKPHCDEHLQVSTLDAEAVLNVAREKNATLVINLCLDQPIEVVVSVAERLGLPHPFGPDTARKVTDKALMKQCMVECGIPTAKHIVLSPSDESDLKDLRFPVVVKPIDSTGSQGVVVANSRAETLAGVKVASQAGRSGKVVVEEFIKGVELNVHCTIQNGDAHILLVAAKNNVFVDHRNTNVFIGSHAPYALSESDTQALQKLVSDIAHCFGILNSPLLVQVLLHEGKFNVIEIAARIGGGMGQRLVLLHTGLDVIDLAVQQYLGYHADISGIGKPKGVIGTIILYARRGVFHEITGANSPEIRSVVLEHHTYKSPDSQIPDGLSSKNRVGAVVLRAENETHLQVVIKAVIQEIDVVDSHGESLFMRELYG